MKKKIIQLWVLIILLVVGMSDELLGDMTSDRNDDPIGRNTIAYFNTLFNGLEKAAQQDPDYDTFRDVMKPVAENTKGFYGGTLINPEWIIIQVYHKGHFLARGFDLKKVKELTEFYNMMKETPTPQLSEPAHGSLIQPRLIAIRYPVIKDSKLKNILSMMVKTQAYLKDVGLDKCRAYKIICKGKLAEEKGKLPKDYKQVKLELPSTEWVIQYQP